jgi:hypothetical protein
MAKKQMLLETVFKLSLEVNLLINIEDYFTDELSDNIEGIQELVDQSAKYLNSDIDLPASLMHGEGAVLFDLKSAVLGIVSLYVKHDTPESLFIIKRYQSIVEIFTLNEIIKDDMSKYIDIKSVNKMGVWEAYTNEAISNYNAGNVDMIIRLK